MIKLFRFIYTLWALLVFHVFMIILFPFFIIPPLLHKRGNVLSWKAIRLWSLIFSSLNRIIYKIEGQENISKDENYVFIVNHTSFLDSPALPQAINRPFRALAKKELTKIPIFGFIVKMVTVVVDRSSPESRQKSKQRLNRVLNEESSILVFPEGTMNRTAEVLQPFYDGAFRIAIDAQVKIIPIVVKGAAKLMRPSSLLMSPGKIKVKVLPPVDTSSYTQKEQKSLKEKIRAQMIEELQSA
ncbi:lysophospholipid acyltransferase family protein [Marivirga atlantica]|jgi:1-acyl-sn-glycerol-3-phosphate acyltransferase|uniref:1-acyl-sn-glycerol-3-phosphate acyltransferase n=1 Tax=Marivirga atlantica TaxID=1548457 RepID=A0A937DKV3_9BACT|nr:lysophospholipid acyltransferase family protein [Marivirga atlantica]MBL0766626.1 1-acyl-sn-glycerol-3-phosphate acyltransferase [Marivirga atlantica]